MKQIRKIILSLSAFCACFFVLDYVIGLWFDNVRHNLPMDGERTAKAEYVINKVDADIVIIGSSRAQSHYDTRVFRDSIPNMSVFNCGGDGQKFWYCDIVTNCILDRYNPKLIIWDFLLDDLKPYNENLSLLYPYYKENDYIRSRLLEREPLLKYQLWLNTYRYNGSGSRIITASRLPKDFGKDRLGYSGHKPLTTISMVFDDLHFETTSPAPDKVESLERTIKKAKDKGIPVVLTISPVVNRIVGNSTTIETLKRICKKYDIIFIDDSQLEGFVGESNKGYDSSHLNSDAAAEFTRTLISQLRIEGVI